MKSHLWAPADVSADDVTVRLQVKTGLVKIWGGARGGNLVVYVMLPFWADRGDRNGRGATVFAG